MKLKAIHANRIYWAVDERPADKEDALLVGEKFYLKSEADRYINKYKRIRCLDMAEKCRLEYDKIDAELNNATSWEYVSPKMKFWEKWRWRWDALADKFKEAE